MLVESDVIAAVCAHLAAHGYMIEQRLKPTQHGIDVIAVRPGRTLWIEAKGETSERAGSERHGKPFDSAQVGVHVAEAFYTGARLLCRPPVDPKRMVAIALPETHFHIRQVAAIQPAITQLKIAIFWVRSDHTVSIDSPREL